MAISGVSERCRKGYLFENLRNSAMYLPACCFSGGGGIRQRSVGRFGERSVGVMSDVRHGEVSTSLPRANTVQVNDRRLEDSSH